MVGISTIFFFWKLKKKSDKFVALYVNYFKTSLLKMIHDYKKSSLHVKVKLYKFENLYDFIHQSSSSWTKIKRQHMIS